VRRAHRRHPLASYRDKTIPYRFYRESNVAQEEVPCRDHRTLPIHAIVPDLTAERAAVVVKAVIRIDHNISDDRRTLVNQVQQLAEHGEKKMDVAAPA
jgi:hypothetical protein